MYNWLDFYNKLDKALSPITLMGNNVEIMTIQSKFITETKIFPEIVNNQIREITNFYRNSYFLALNFYNNM